VLDSSVTPEHYVGRLESAVERLEWETDDLTVCYQALSVGTVLGSGSHWPHVFAVMSALAGRFGDDGVRLVVAFD
jgi:hypothetical protein